jgi:hypothetical protein
MKHTLKVKDLNNLRLSEATMAVCDAAEKLKQAARTYADKVPKNEPSGLPSNVDFVDQSPEGKALEAAARDFSLWYDALAHVKVREKL